MKGIFVELDSLLIPGPPFGTMLIFMQIPLIERSVMFNVQSSPAWIEEKPTDFYVNSKV